MEDGPKKYGDYLRSAAQQAQRDFGRTLLYLAAGGLGVTVPFIPWIVRDQSPQMLWGLIGGWWSWVACLGVALIAFQANKLGLDKARNDWMKDQIREPNKDPERFNRKNPGKGWAILAEILNYLALVLFIIGLVFVVSFAIANTGGR